MKSKLTAMLAALLLGLTFASAQTVITNTGCVEFSWDNPAPADDIHAYVLYHTTNYVAPVWPQFAGWSVIGVATNGATTNTQINISVGPNFFFLVASNAWGNGYPSNVVGTSNGPPTVLNFKITAQTMLPCP